MTPTTITAAAHQSAAQIAERTTVPSHDLALVLGSGWANALDQLGDLRATIPLDELVGFHAPAVEGHGGQLHSIDLDGKRLLAFTGRTHYYETRDVTAVAHAVRTAAATGCHTVLLTNACGAINPDIDPGDLVLIEDHINLTGASPLTGATFVDLTDLYSADLRAQCKDAVPHLGSGVYAGYWGPNYETPAEIRAYRTMGAELVGMSTVLEAIAAHAAGMNVVALSLVTNRAAGMGERLDHTEVLATAAARSAKAAATLTRLAPLLASWEPPSSS